ncbi:peptidoglycan-associated lipoprotein [Marinobacterium nitratireducens]|uniref:Peptidoglycan-associated lipoprotein n=1 Tax=Marinobacterium nitratireducens TaxID=518897 RepID=A0A917ZDV5_9GAMM|nr:peptidoglycan-associated lipoprotein Pal [Marinobacterium nitratireducens]GGO80677.1 peptidoglycan-associated lipoprotein [Marinobacterium nitratireducens]
MRALKVTKVAALALTFAWMAGCSSTSTQTDSSDLSGGMGGTDGAMTSGMGDSGSLSGSSLPGAVANLQTVFYFDFDQSTVRSDSIADLEAHARYLASNPQAQVRLEGHADERGTREYNMALGERRGNAVSRFLMVNGVSSGQVEVVSYGEEKPAIMGHDNSSWSENRRVELKYVN